TKTNKGMWLSNLVTGYSKTIVACFVVIIAIAAWYSQTFRVDASAETLLTKNNKLYIQTQMMDSRFAPQEFILVAYQPKQGELFSQQAFDDIAQLSEDFQRIERVEETTSILNVPLISMMDGFNPDVNASDWTWQA